MAGPVVPEARNAVVPEARNAVVPEARNAVVPEAPRRDDWPAQAADRIEATVGTLRDRTVRPLTVAVRAVVYGLLAGVLGIAVIVLLTIAALRVADVYLDYIPRVPDRVWFADLVVGMIFTVLGLFLWTKRRRKK